MIVLFTINDTIFDILKTWEPVLIQGERTFFTQDGVMMDYLSGNGYPGQGHHYYCVKGKLYLTNRRVIYVPPKPQAFFDTLTVPLPNLQEGKLVQPWFGANRYEGVCVPVPNGGLPVAGTVTWTFKEGGAFEFSTFHRQLTSRIEGTAPYQQSEDDFLPAYAAPPSDPPISAYDPIGPPPGNPTEQSSIPIFAASIPPATAVSVAETTPAITAYEISPSSEQPRDVPVSLLDAGEVLPESGSAVMTPTVGAVLTEESK
ncbi:hypothetical protein BC829DRAFT_399222 [Chytridium lagenaria]|nr:hypothetical protein BC829DRAFT_399222 [Chytridium lagenaria]